MNVNQLPRASSSFDLTRITPSNRNMSPQQRQFSTEGKTKESNIDMDKKNEQLSTEDLNKIVEDTSKLIPPHQHLRFQVHEETDRIFVEVVDLDTDEVIKELPPKEFLDMIARIREYVGLLIDEKI